MDGWKEVSSSLLLNLVDHLIELQTRIMVGLSDSVTTFTLCE